MRSNRLTAVVRTASVAAMCASVGGVLGCGDLPIPNRLDPTPLGPVVAEVMIGGPRSTTVQERVQLTATVVFVGGATQDVTSVARWDSSDASIATVTNGSIRPVAQGEAEIRATYEEVTGRALLRVAPTQ
jgi:Big-like domain-containing protein